MFFSRQGIAILTVVFALIALVGAQDNQAGDDLAQGAIWLRWSKEQRATYVTGYVRGVKKGYASGCRAAEKIRPQQKFKNTELSSFGQCVAQAPSFSRDPSTYQDEVTQFYNSFPKDRELAIDRVLDLLSDRESKSLTEIDKMYHSGSLR